MSQNTNLPDLVIREVTSDIWTFSRPFGRGPFGFLPWGGRSTAVKLSSGDVWVLASTPLTEDTKTTIDSLGTVKWIISADIVHHIFLGQFKKAYPEAKVIGVDGLKEKKKQNKEDLVIDGEYGVDSPSALYGFEDEIKACYFSGFANKDVAFLHVASRTLIVADLLFNLPGTEQYSKSKTSPKIPIIGKLNPESGLLKWLLWSIGDNKDAMRRDIKTVCDWDFDRVIMCHGDVIESDGKKAWENSYSKYLS
ncbi:hypothetical protein BT96DRAFT_889413 [Gymnopus androsaceus JB14]|uniref:Metallo-beta-lactamase domain-containing protein n=1 Tax=Gymnopus androsaceus JB14 TaxID=1447944 RepID=A0A6A4GWT5_9AGAR|nr:hypothetical protein BT96DRAFT_889413 [Gymnopus androsaceus JB14]